MSSKRKRSKGTLNVVEIADLAKSNPYIQRLIDDPKLRKNVRTAIDSSRSAYGRLSNGKLPSRALLEDRKLHSDLGKALAAARDVTITMTLARQRQRRRRMSFSRRVLIVTVSAALALALSETLRSKVLDLLFGAEEEFQYTPPPAAPASTPESTVGAA